MIRTTAEEFTTVVGQLFERWPSIDRIDKDRRIQMSCNGSLENVDRVEVTLLLTQLWVSPVKPWVAVHELDVSCGLPLLGWQMKPSVIIRTCDDHVRCWVSFLGIGDVHRMIDQSKIVDWAEDCPLVRTASNLDCRLVFCDDDQASVALLGCFIVFFFGHDLGDRV